MAGRNIAITLSLCLMWSGMGSCWQYHRPSWAVKEFRASLETDAELLRPQLVRISNDLVKLPSQSSVEDKFSLLEKLHNSRSPLNRLRGDYKSKKSALEKLISLKSLAGQECDQHTLDVLETIKMAVQGFRNYEDVGGIANIVGYCLAKHVAACMPIYKKKYNEMVAKSELAAGAIQERRVHAALDELQADDFYGTLGMFHCVSSPICRLVMMAELELEKEPIATNKVALQIGKQLKGSSQADSMDELTDDELRVVLDQYLFGPCKQFRNKFAPVLEEALILITSADYKQYLTIFAKDEGGFLHTIFEYGFCGKLLAERRQFERKFLASWPLAPELYE